MERKVLLKKVLYKSWVGDRSVGVDRSVGDDESGGRESVEIWVG
jgi:hypothetical protein